MDNVGGQRDSKRVPTCPSATLGLQTDKWGRGGGQSVRLKLKRVKCCPQKGADKVSAVDRKIRRPKC